MKKILSLVMCVMLAATLFVAAPAYADETTWTVPEGYTRIGTSTTAWKFDSDAQTLYITGTGGTPNNTKISGLSGITQTSVTKIVVEAGVTEIGYQSLYGFTKVTEIQLPGTLQKLQADAFGVCSLLSTITLPESLTMVGDYVFNNCKALTEITIPKSVTSIGRDVFQYSTVKKVVFEGNRTSELKIKRTYKTNSTTGAVSIDAGTFGLAHELTEIYLPEKVKIVTDSSTDTENVTDVYHLFDKASTYTSNDANPLKVTIYTEDSGVKTIIDGLTDSESRGKPTVYVVPVGTEKCGKMTLPADGYWTYGDGTLNIYGTGDCGSSYWKCSYPWKDQVVGTDVKKVVFNEGITSVPAYFVSNEDYKDSGTNKTYKKMVNIEEVTFPSTLKTIGDGAFINCTNLDKINGGFPEGLESIGKQAFQGCLIPANVGNSLVLPASLKSIGNSAFNKGGASKETFSAVLFAKGSKLETIGESAFCNRYGIRTVEIPSTVTSIGANAFNSGAGDDLKVYFEGSKPTTIGNNAFARTGSNASVKVYCYEDGYAASDFGSLAYLTITKKDLDVEASITLDTTDDSNVVAKVSYRAPEKMTANQEYVLIIAAYDNDGTLVSVDITKTGTFESDSTSIEKGEVTQTISKVTGATTYKAFLWDSLTNIVPIASAK